MSPPPEVIALFGPTAVGKTAVAVALADRLRALGERPIAVSADALQVYAGLERLTGVADADQQARLEHRLVSFVPIDQPFSAGAYAARAHAEIDALLAAGARPIVLGGTGLYLRAALTELSLRPPSDPSVRAQLTEELRERGPQHLHERLAVAVPWRAAQIEPGDSHRIIRALELLAAGQLTPHRSDSELWTGEVRHPTLLIGLQRERAELYELIDRRVDAMVAAGVEDEVRAADRAGASATARAALGFQDLLDGDIDAMKRHTRNYARRQLTWMRKLAAVHHFDLTDRDPGDAAAEIERLWLTAAV
ncbi:MAG: tRNA (adenosine(37)-N6)-dimethylallyltransferase MiaA [Solirubrobacteraceae bacterium]